MLPRKLWMWCRWHSWGINKEGKEITILHNLEHPLVEHDIPPAGEVKGDSISNRAIVFRQGQIKVIWQLIWEVGLGTG